MSSLKILISKNAISFIVILIVGKFCIKETNMLNSSLQSHLIPSMFVSTAIAMIFTQFAGYAAVFTDGVITSRALGHEAYSAISLSPTSLIY